MSRPTDAAITDRDHALNWLVGAVRLRDEEEFYHLCGFRLLPHYQSLGLGSRLLLAISKRMADRLRETTRKLKTFAQMNKALQQELQVVMNNRTGLEAQKRR